MSETFERLPDEKKELITKTCLQEFGRKSYQDANTDVIVKNSDISKGSLYYYFGNKKGVYLYILKISLQRLVSTQYTDDTQITTFHDVLQSAWNNKIKQVKQYPLETVFVNNAAKERCEEVYKEKEEVLQDYMDKGRERSYRTLEKALLSCNLKKNTDLKIAVKGLSIYLNSIIMECLKKYSDKPMVLFEESDSVFAEMEQYLQIFLNGIIAK